MITCACGCGKEFGELDKWGRKRRFILGHNTRLNPPMKNPETVKKSNIKRIKSIPDPILCLCGCGGYARSRRKYINGHCRRGILRPDVSERFKQRVGNKHPMFGKKGDKCPNWRGGTHSLPYGPDFTKELKLQIKSRDNFECQLCHSIFHLIPHHIDHDKFNNHPLNLITLCDSCNHKVEGKKVRNEYERCFKIMMTMNYGVD